MLLRTTSCAVSDFLWSTLQMESFPSAVRSESGEIWVRDGTERAFRKLSLSE